MFVIGLKCEETSLLNGQVDCTNDNFYGSFCTYKCSEGYELIGNSVSKCTSSGNGNTYWDNDAPTCTS